MAEVIEKLRTSEDDIESIRALVEELRSEHLEAPAEEEAGDADAAHRTVPEELLQTDTRVGLNEQEVVARRRKYGLNKMKQESQNLIIKFLGYFIGPIQFVMEAAAILACGLQQWIDFGVICALLLLNASVGFIQEFQVRFPWTSTGAVTDHPILP